MTVVLALLVIVGALLLAFARHRYGAALVMAALAVVIWFNHNMSSWEWVTFVILFLVGLGLTLYSSLRQGGCVAVGSIVLLIAIFMVTAWPWQWGGVWNWLVSVNWINWLAIFTVLAIIAAGVILLAVFRRVPMLVGGVAALAALLAFAMVFVSMTGGTVGPKPGGASSDLSGFLPKDKTEQASKKDTSDAVDCPVQFRQRDLTDKQKARLKKDGIDAKSAEKASDNNLEMLGHQAKLLHAVAVTQFHLNDVPAASKMVNADKTCLSKAGRQVHHDLGVVMDASTKQFADAPANGYNTGAVNGQLVVDKSAGVSGNRKAVKYTLPDGSVAYTMVRCGNPVFVTVPKGVPTGKTDNPKPPKPPKTPKPPKPTPPGEGGCKEIPGNGKLECDHKDSDKKDYVYPEDKPSVTAESKPTRPTKVETSTTGGGGVVDKPTNTPGSETGGTAPGASTPTPTPRDTNPGEGGSTTGGGDTNDGTVDKP